MRILRLLATAAEAEGLRLRRESVNIARRAALLGGAACCGVLALVMLHLALWYWLVVPAGPAGAAAIVAGLDLAVALVLVLLARHRYDPVAQEALAIRRTSLRALTQQDPMAETLRRVAAAIMAAGIDAVVTRLRR